MITILGGGCSTLFFLSFGSFTVIYTTKKLEDGTEDFVFQPFLDIMSRN
jgi:hypothetical protein